MERAWIIVECICRILGISTAAAVKKTYPPARPVPLCTAVDSKVLGDLNTSTRCERPSALTVLVWHAIIPGTMLVTTGFSYFIISKKKKTKLSKDPASQSERYANPSATLVDVTETGDTEQTYSFNNPVKKQKTTPLAYLESILKMKPSKKNEPSMLHQSFPEDKPPINMGRKRQEHIEENAVTMIADESESLYNHDMGLEENTSDTTPIIRS
ncbi:UNVERIFIED_CONTAM: hypothetical protein FKN15_021266 [Acipenser sinensis]